MTTVTELSVHQIVPGQNDRTVFDPHALQELAASIGEYGLAQPITVRPVEQCSECNYITAGGDAPEVCPVCGNDLWLPLFQIVAGERRFRAIGLLGLDSIPALVRRLNDEHASAIMLTENIARADLDPVDEALAYQRRIDDYGWSVGELAAIAGVSAVRVRFRLKLLALRSDIQKLVRDGHLPLGYAQILSDANLDPNRQLIALRRLRDNHAPTPAWFRREVSNLQEEQCQDSLFDAAMFTLQPTEADAAPAYREPAHPSTTQPPAKGVTLAEVLRHQVAFWTQAAREWDLLGKPFKRQECEAAAQALNLALAAV